MTKTILFIISLLSIPAFSSEPNMCYQVYSQKMNNVCAKTCALKNKPSQNIVENEKAEVGDVTKCPVSGVIFKVKESTPQIEYQKQKIKFCCQGCANKFKQKTKES